MDECKKVTRESLTEWAFGQDLALTLQPVLSAVRLRMCQLGVTHVALQCDFGLCVIEARTAIRMRKTSNGRGAACRTMRSSTVWQLVLHVIRGRGEGGGSVKTRNTVNERKMRCRKLVLGRRRRAAYSDGRAARRAPRGEQEKHSERSASACSTLWCDCLRKSR